MAISGAAAAMSLEAREVVYPTFCIIKITIGGGLRNLARRELSPRRMVLPTSREADFLPRLVIHLPAGRGLLC